MITFEYYIELEEGKGYRPTLSENEENEITIQIKAKNRATADRMIKSIINYDAVANMNGIALD